MADSTVSCPQQQSTKVSEFQNKILKENFKFTESQINNYDASKHFPAE